MPDNITNINYLFDWGPQQAYDKAQQIVAEQTQGKAPAHNKQAILIFGMPGSGKSTIAKQIIKKDDSFAYLSIDEIFKGSPHYSEIVTPQRFNEKKDPFSDGNFINYGFDVLNFAIEDLSLQSRPLIIDGVSGRTIPSLYKYFRSHSFSTNVLMTAVPKRIMDINMLTRYIMVKNKEDSHFFFALKRPPSMIRYYTESLDNYQSQNINMLIVNPMQDKILYDSKKDSSQKFSDVFLRELYRPLTADEIQNIKIRRKTLLEKVTLIPNEIEQRQLTHALNACLLPFKTKGNFHEK